MKPAQLSIQIDNIRAIKNADIKIDGITVIAGENGCGKSTISKLVYYFFKTNINYDDHINKLFQSDLNSIIKTLDSFFIDTELNNYNFKSIIPNYLAEIVKIGTNNKDELNQFIDDFIEELKDSFKEIEKNLKDSESKIKRLKYNLSSNIKDILNANTLLEVLICTFNYLNEKYKLNVLYKEHRPSSYLYEIISRNFIDYPLPTTYNISEYGVPLIEGERLLHQSSIDNIAYIDTPMALGQEKNPNNPHWEDLNEILKKKPIANNNIKDFFNSEILAGDFKYLSESYGHKQFAYKRSDGLEFDLLESATGLKSFAFLQILIKNGFLNNKTLLLIDEPEAHLHPQWIVEYAKLIVQLNKSLGVKFLIASHNPDMISAIKYIYSKENTKSELNFYLAEKTNDKFMYSYKDLGTNIEPIFESFNIALDKIEEYGTIL